MHSNIPQNGYWKRSENASKQLIHFGLSERVRSILDSVRKYGGAFYSNVIFYAIGTACTATAIQLTEPVKVEGVSCLCVSGLNVIVDNATTQGEQQRQQRTHNRRATWRVKCKPGNGPACVYDLWGRESSCRAWRHGSLIGVNYSSKSLFYCLSVTAAARYVTSLEPARLLCCLLYWSSN